MRIAKRSVSVFFIAVLSGLLTGADAAGIGWLGRLGGKKELVVVEQGQSAFSIYVATNAPDSVKMGAVDLQRTVELATGVKLAVTNVPAAPMICLGDNEAARQAGYSAESLPDDAFVIGVKKGSVYIVGKDDAWHPVKIGDGFTFDNEAASKGTLNGVYEFLERFADARWLMPGEGGEDIPRRDTLAIPGGKIKVDPKMKGRHLDGLQANAYYESRVAVRDWIRRNRLGGTLDPQCGHIWEKVIPRDVLIAHPDYMAMLDGRRTRLDDPGHPDNAVEHIKFCTTNPDLIQAFADGIMAMMAQSPGQKYFSISPTDGYKFCACDACKALDEPCDWDGWRLTHGKNIHGPYNGKSLTRRLLTFYNAVSRIVATRQPGKVLGCYAYDMTTYPPMAPMTIESNLFVLVAPAQYYGGSLYRPELQAEFPRLMHAWDSLAPGRVGYLDYPVIMLELNLAIGAPQPPGRSILKCIFATFNREKQIEYIYLSGSEAWGYGGLYNYAAARLMWNPAADVDALFDEWLRRAYGKGAAPMGQLYALLEREIGDYKRTHKVGDWSLAEDLARQLYPRLFSDMERLYVQALAAAETERQKARVAMFGDNLILLHWNLRKGGLLNDPEQSVFYRSDEGFRAFAEKAYRSLAVRPGIARSLDVALEQFMKPRLAPAEPKTKPAR